MTHWEFLLWLCIWTIPACVLSLFNKPVSIATINNKNTEEKKSVVTEKEEEYDDPFFNP